MGLVHGIVAACLFLLLLSAIEHHFRRSKLPYLCWMVLFGMGYGMIQIQMGKAIPDLRLDPDVILYCFLPLLIFDSARKIELKTAEAVALPSILLATVGVVLSMFVMAVPVSMATDLPWMDILLFTGIMSATDPVAVSAIFKEFPLPRRLRMLVEGESLLNDGTAVILYTLLGKQVLQGEILTLPSVSVFLLLSTGSAVLIGICAGLGGAWLLKRWKALKDHFIGPMLPLLVVYLVFCVTQYSLDFSGVIAVLCATMTIRVMFFRYWMHDLPKRCELEFYDELWDFIGSLANAVLFFLLGVEIGSNLGDLGWTMILVGILALVLSRSVVVYAFGVVFRLMKLDVPLSWLHVLNIGGLRGALPVALVLMLPVDYPYRNAFLGGALSMGVFTLVFHPLAMRAYLKRSDLSDAQSP